jgi:pyruvate, orthophosphate dikinase
VSAGQIHDFDAPPAGTHDELTRLLGGKGANLVIMATELGMPVPPGFTITTEACIDFLSGRWPPGLDDALRTHMDRLGELVGRRFGDLADPLLVSVRSGAPASMPGMMDTILDLGLNEASARGLGAVAGDAAFAADCLRRFRDGYRAVIGPGEVPEDPWEQLRAAIEAVFRSWNSARARAYRRVEGIPDDLGTAVTVQVMVFGNRVPDSATGVLFTRNPATGEPVPYGDVLFAAQGEDVVAGDHAPESIAVLDERLPEVAADLRRHAATLERAYRDLCDIEFTVEEGRLWLLQVRVGKRSPRAALRMAIDMADDPAFPLTRAEAVRRVAHLLVDPPREFVRSGDAATPVTIGLPASPGVASGMVVTSAEAAERAAATGQAVILVRPETSPADVAGMATAAGVLTTKGGLASHAAVVARGWGIPAVVGASGVRVLDDAIEVDGEAVDVGQELTIDGSTGEVHLGRLPGKVEMAPEAATLIGWAAELGIELEAADPDGAEPDGAERSTDRPVVDVAPDDVIRRLLIIGPVEADTLAETLGTESARIDVAVEQAVSDGHVERADGTLRLSAEGKLRALTLLTADRDRIGQARSDELLVAFHALDLRMKEIVTAWQVREVAGVQALNDHSDPKYDARVLADLVALHAEATGWLGPIIHALPRFGTYRTRLARAATLARDGDQRFVTSPRVDSFHGVWFELHEDLIRLAGRRRSDEASAGRA